MFDIENYYEFLEKTLKDKPIVLAGRTASNYLGMTLNINCDIEVYVEEYQKDLDLLSFDIYEFKQYLIKDFARLDFIIINGIKCTSINKTIIDLLKIVRKESFEMEYLIDALSFYKWQFGNFQTLKIPKKYRLDFQNAIEEMEEYNYGKLKAR